MDAAGKEIVHWGFNLNTKTRTSLTASSTHTSDVKPTRLGKAHPSGNYEHHEYPQPQILCEPCHG